MKKIAFAVTAVTFAILNCLFGEAPKAKKRLCRRSKKTESSTFQVFGQRAICYFFKVGSLPNSWMGKSRIETKGIVCSYLCNKQLFGQVVIYVRPNFKHNLNALEEV